MIKDTILSMNSRVVSFELCQREEEEEEDDNEEEEEVEEAV